MVKAKSPGPRWPSSKRPSQPTRVSPDVVTTRRRVGTCSMTPRRVRPLPMSSHRHDVVVVGGGPAGAAAAYWLARAGHDVVIVERKTFPREKTCGDGLTPRAVHQLEEMGLAGELPATTVTKACGRSPTGARSRCAGPSTPSSPPMAMSCVAVIWTPSSPRPPCGRSPLRQGCDAVAPCSATAWWLAPPSATRRGDGRGRPARPRTSIARYVVIADGANSRFGRALGTAGTSSCSAWESERGVGQPRLDQVRVAGHDRRPSLRRYWRLVGE